ncbi:MAG: Sensor kinase CckA [Pseudidiomarina mangrovi]|nr:MAG: Sensor kinase CckA [Pseudidiomarina mangrovi]
MLTNLLINAGQAIEENGKISIRTKQNCDVITLEVADNGCGIPDENLKKLFDPFFTTKPIGEGTGLGLAISYGIVRDHEGKISVESTPDKGTCFSLTFPRADKILMKEAI